MYALRICCVHHIADIAKESYNRNCGGLNGFTYEGVEGEGRKISLGPVRQRFDKIRRKLVE